MKMNKNIQETCIPKIFEYPESETAILVYCQLFSSKFIAYEIIKDNNTWLIVCGYVPKQLLNDKNRIVKYKNRDWILMGYYVPINADYQPWLKNYYKEPCFWFTTYNNDSITKEKGNRPCLKILKQKKIKLIHQTYEDTI